MNRTAVVIMISLPLLACGVPRGKYTALEEQLNTCKGGLSEFQAAHKACLERLTTAETAKGNLEKKTKTYTDLVESLREEIDAGEVKISQLRGRVTVNLANRILFDSGETALKEAGTNALRKVAGVLKAVEGKRIQVEGHTDNVLLGPALQKRFPTNWELSTARATSVVRQLATLGVEEPRMSAAGYGRFAPIEPNETEEGRQANRRIEIVLVPAFASTRDVSPESEGDKSEAPEKPEAPSVQPPEKEDK